MRRLTITPAYGRDYTSAKAAKADFTANLDFIICDISCQWDGKPCSRADLIGNVDIVTIRYSSLRKVCTERVK